MSITAILAHLLLKIGDCITASCAIRVQTGAEHVGHCGIDWNKGQLAATCKFWAYGQCAARVGAVQIVDELETVLQPLTFSHAKEQWPHPPRTLLH